MTETEQILTFLLDCRRVDLYADKPVLNPLQEEKMTEIKRRRKNGEPLQYILGHCEFMGLKFFVDKRVLIPRPETELLVEAVIAKSKRWDGKPLSILDIGTGSGNIAVSLAKRIAGCRVTAVDISKDALCVARANAALNGVGAQIDFLQSDIFSCWQNTILTDGLFDIIVSNPPYVKQTDINYLPEDVKHEPYVALDGGNDGLDFYRHIIKEAPRYLTPNGLLCFEIGDGQKETVEGMFQKSKKFNWVDCLKDYAHTERIMIAELKNNG